jgi:uncharacterized Zn-binding protein involved in type VI secretion
MHVCPMVTPGTPPIPHVGGPIVGPGCPTVLICNMPAATMGDMCTCVGPPDTIVLGSTGVFIGGKMAARMGDMCAHGGMITMGAPTVLIGEISPGGPGAPILAGLMGAIGKGMNVLIELLEGDLDVMAAKAQAAGTGAIGGSLKGVMRGVSAAMAKGMEAMIHAALPDHPAAAAKATDIAKMTMAMGRAAEEGAAGVIKCAQ